MISPRKILVLLLLVATVAYGFIFAPWAIRTVDLGSREFSPWPSHHISKSYSVGPKFVLVKYKEATDEESRRREADFCQLALALPPKPRFYGWPFIVVEKLDYNMCYSSEQRYLAIYPVPLLLLAIAAGASGLVVSHLASTRVNKKKGNKTSK